VALVGLVVGLTALTGLTIGGVAWLEQRARSHAIVDAAMAQAARLTAAHAARFLHDAESAARLGPQLVAERQLDLDDDAELERFTLAMLRAHPQLSWVSYGDRDDRFVGAWRDADGAVHLNRSFPRAGRIRLEEDRVLPGGGRIPIRRSDDHGYRPTTRPFFRLAEARRTVTWTDPYEFYAGGGPGITCVAPVLDAAGAVRGVFTVDFSLARLTDFLNAVDVSRQGRVFIASRSGRLIAGQESRREGGDGITPALASAASSRLARGEDRPFELTVNGERYVARSVALGLGDPEWLVEVVVPVRDYTEQADAQGWRSLVLGVLALAVAGACGVGFTGWLARPLRELADAARRIRQGDLDIALVPRSRDELGVLTRAVADMVRALKDRDFMRDTLGRYVSPEIAERLLRDRAAPRLGGELREVTILMSDLRGFSELSERLGPEAMMTVLNGYLARMTEVIRQHGGTIDEFIGDAILVLFGAPTEHPDDPERAVRCAWAMQRTLTELNEEHRQRGVPELGMGIGVHRGPVVVGNIGGADRAKYGVVGPAVNLTSRLQALTAAGEILISAPLAGRVRTAVRLGMPERVRVKGVPDPVTVHRVLGLRDADPQPAAAIETAAS
jgi:class 3 adenylate cyclase